MVNERPKNKKPDLKFKGVETVDLDFPDNPNFTADDEVEIEHWLSSFKDSDLIKNLREVISKIRSKRSKD